MKTIIIKTVGFYLNIVCKLLPKYGVNFGFKLFCTPFGSKLHTHQAAFLNQAQKFTIAFNNKQLQGYKWGNGPKVVVLYHGWAVNAFRFKALINILNTGQYTIYAMDAPAHGASTDFSTCTMPLYSQAMEAFYQHIGLVHTSIGHSIGGATLILAAHNNPQNNYGNLCIMAAPGAVPDFFKYYQKLAGIWPSTLKLLEQKFCETIGYEPAYFTTENLCKNINNKTLIIHDTDDAECPYHYATLLEKNMPNATLLTTTGYGHSLKNKAVYQALINWCAQ
jgi:pimeloyl-ACP methyl ester carboxylesterase